MTCGRDTPRLWGDEVTLYELFHPPLDRTAMLVDTKRPMRGHLKMLNLPRYSAGPTQNLAVLQQRADDIRHQLDRARKTKDRGS